VHQNEITSLWPLLLHSLVQFSYTCPTTRRLLKVFLLEEYELRSTLRDSIQWRTVLTWEWCFASDYTASSALVDRRSVCTFADRVTMLARRCVMDDAMQPLDWITQVRAGHSWLVGHVGAFSSASFSERLLNHDAIVPPRGRVFFLSSKRSGKRSLGDEFISSWIIVRRSRSSTPRFSENLNINCEKNCCFFKRKLSEIRCILCSMCRPVFGADFQKEVSCDKIVVGIL